MENVDSLPPTPPRHPRHLPRGPHQSQRRLPRDLANRAPHPGQGLPQPRRRPRSGSSTRAAAATAAPRMGADPDLSSGSWSTTWMFSRALSCYVKLPRRRVLQSLRDLCTEGLDEITNKALTSSDGSKKCDFVSLVQNWLIRIQESSSLNGTFGETSQSELAAFTSYALAFPNSFLALVDTYDVMRSGVPNFCAVALALNDMGYKAVGIRLDSGDLAYLSMETRKFFCAIEKEFGVVGFGKTSITASNDLNEETIDALNKQGHEVDAFGIGTNLVTCYAQAALGCVFKLVEINKQPRIKLSEDVTKVSIPCKKKCYRLYGKEGYPLVDIMTGEDEPGPKIGERLLCRHPFNESKRAYVVPQHVEELLRCYWPGTSSNPREVLPSIHEIRTRCIQHLDRMRPDHMRRLNPTPYKVSVSTKLYDFIHFLWLNEAPVGELQ